MPRPRWAAGNDGSSETADSKAASAEAVSKDRSDLSPLADSAAAAVRLVERRGRGRSARATFCGVGSATGSGAAVWVRAGDGIGSGAAAWVRAGDGVGSGDAAWGWGGAGVGEGVWLVLGLVGV